MAVARPSDGRHQVTCPYRLGNPPVFSQLQVEGYEVAVFVRHGAVLGMLGPGVHSLSPTGAPFLEAAKSTDGRSYECEIIFVTTAGTRLALDGSIGSLTDTSGRAAEFFVMGAVEVTTSDPARVVAHGIGVGEPGDAFDRIVVRRVMQGIQQHLAGLFERGRADPRELRSVGPALVRAGRADALGLAVTGLEVRALEINRLVSRENRPPAGTDAPKLRARVAFDDQLPDHQSCRFGAARLPVWDTEFGMTAHLSVVGHFVGEHVGPEHETWMVDRIKLALREALQTWNGSVLDLPGKKAEWEGYVTAVVAPQLEARAELRGRVVIEAVEIDPQEASELKRRRGAKLGRR